MRRRDGHFVPFDVLGRDGCSMQLVDAHTHISPAQHEQATELAQRGLWQFVTATSSDDCARVLDLAKTSPRIIPICGLHPWFAADFDPRVLKKWLQQVPIIGEIGLDTVWTQVPIDVQLKAFLYQLQLAESFGKPVILHTKGAEAEVLQWLRRYMPPKAIVHWYSGDAKHLEGYIELGCYFTLGPDIQDNQAVQAVCRQVPLERLLTETDGIDAVAWATGEPCALPEVPQILLKTIATAAAIRSITPAEMQDAVYENSLALLLRNRV